MAYNNYFPQTYTSTPYGYGAGAIPQTQVMQQPAQQPVQQPIQPVQSTSQPAPQPMQRGVITWVQGEAGAKSAPVYPGTDVMLMDSETNRFYIKAADLTGRPLPLRKFQYEEIFDEQDGPAPATYITKDELEQRLSEFKKTLGDKEHEFDI